MIRSRASLDRNFRVGAGKNCSDPITSAAALGQFTSVTAGEGGHKSRLRKALRNVLSSQAALFVAGVASGLLLSLLGRRPQTLPVAHPHPAAGQGLALADNVLVVYSFFEGDEASWGNLEFFVEQAVEADDGAQYVFVLNGLTSLNDPRLPRLPPSARYVLHENECYDWGTYAWVFSDVQDPQHFQCTNSTCLCQYSL